MFDSLIGRSILMNWAFAQQLGVLIPQRELDTSSPKLFTGVQWKQISVDLDNGSKRDSVQWRLYVSLGLNAVTYSKVF